MTGQVSDGIQMIPLHLVYLEKHGPYPVTRPAEIGSILHSGSIEIFLFPASDPRLV